MDRCSSCALKPTGGTQCHMPRHFTATRRVDATTHTTPKEPNTKVLLQIRNLTASSGVPTVGVTRCGIAIIVYYAEAAQYTIQYKIQNKEPYKITVSPIYQLSPWIRQLEVDVGLCADAAWDMASDQEVWRAQRPVAGQAVQ